MSVTQERLKLLLDYDPQTGHFTWKTRTVKTHFDVIWNKRFSGKRAGHSHKMGYIVLCVERAKIMAHQAAWAYQSGDMPAGDIDHVNGIKSDNRICNLRVATRSQNMANTSRRSSNTTGFKGVTMDRRTGRYIAAVHPNGKKRHLGVFDTAEAAHDAYVAGALKYYGEFARAS